MTAGVNWREFIIFGGRRRVFGLLVLLAEEMDARPGVFKRDPLSVKQDEAEQSLTCYRRTSKHVIPFLVQARA